MFAYYALVDIIADDCTTCSLVIKENECIYLNKYRAWQELSGLGFAPHKP